MKKYLKNIVITFFVLIILSITAYIILKVNAVKDDRVREIVKLKRYSLSDEIDINLIAKNIPLLDYALEYDSYTIDVDNQKLFLNYRLKDGMKRTDIYYDNVKYNAEIYFALIRTLKEVRLQVTFINDANEEEVATYSHFQDATSFFSYDDNRDKFEGKFVNIMNKYVEGYNNENEEIIEDTKIETSKKINDEDKYENDRVFIFSQDYEDSIFELDESCKEYFKIEVQKNTTNNTSSVKVIPIKEVENLSLVIYEIHKEDNVPKAVNMYTYDVINEYNLDNQLVTNYKE